MNYKTLLIVLLLLTTNGCRCYRLSPQYQLDKGYKGYILQSQANHYWQGTDNRIRYSYQVDSIRDIFIYGIFIVGEKDTIHTRSFEKGNLYPSWCLDTQYKNKDVFFFRYTHLTNDTLLLLRSDSLNIKNDVPLIRIKKGL